MKIWRFTALCLLLASVLYAEEGMWRFDQVPFDRIEKDYGAKLTSAELGKLQGAAVRILSGGGGGTGTFASSNGLILTNHHVALDCIRSSSLAEKRGDAEEVGDVENLVENGFTAASLSEELPCRRFVVQFERESEDVTAQMDSVITDAMSPEEIQAARQATRSELERNCREAKGASVSCSVEEFNSGARSLLVTYEEFRDIRLVYAPEKQLGYFGGDEMNFRFPRYVSDISILRAYESEDGSRDEFAETNVPHHPKHFLSVSFDGVKDQDVSLVAGFPGNTNRYRMSFSADYNLKKGIPNQLEDIDRELELLKRYAGESEQYQLILQNRIFGLSNARKYLADVRMALEASDIVADRRQREDGFIAFIEQSPELKNHFAGVLDRQSAVYRDDVEANDELDSALTWLSKSSTFSYAFGLYEFALERAKDADADREPQFQQRNWDRVRQSLLDETPVIEGLERDFLTIGFEKALALDGAKRMAGLDRWIEAAGLEKPGAEQLARMVLNESKIADVQTRESLVMEDVPAFEQSNDSALEFARAALPAVQDRRHRVRVLNQKLFTNRALFARGMMAWKKAELYPDANFTLRLSVGKVAGYNDRRGSSVPFATRMDGLFRLADERDNVGDFALPERLRAWREAMGDEAFESTYADLPVNFVSTNDITGGNSGSALLNESLQIVGLIFDGNEAATASDWTYTEVAGRAISTDIRFALTIAESIHGAGHIVQELRKASKQ